MEAAEQRLKPQPIEQAPAPEQMEVEQQPPQPGAGPENVPMEGPVEAQAPSAEAEMDEDTRDLYSQSDPAEVDDASMGAIIPILANIAIEKIKFGHHVTEVYSPPRVNISATKIGLVPGMSLDLTEVDPVDGKPWDFTDTVKRTRARERVISERPFLLIGCPPCTAFGTLFGLNKARGHMNPEEVRRKEIEGRIHLAFCMELYEIQIKASRYFLHEHPRNATSWAEPCICLLYTSPSPRD